MAAEAKIWRATVLTLFPEMFPGPLGVSLAGRRVVIELPPEIDGDDPNHPLAD